MGDTVSPILLQDFATTHQFISAAIHGSGTDKEPHYTIRGFDGTTAVCAIHVFAGGRKFKFFDGSGKIWEDKPLIWDRYEIISE